MLSSSPLFNWTRHFPQAPFPEHGASIATLALRATSSKLSPALANASTVLPFSKAKVTLNIRRNGELTKKLTVQANAFSAAAKEKIEALGGKAEVI